VAKFPRWFQQNTAIQCQLKSAKKRRRLVEAKNYGMRIQHRPGYWPPNRPDCCAARSKRSISIIRVFQIHLE
jgi:hypothetical protein